MTEGRRALLAAAAVALLGAAAVLPRILDAPVLSPDATEYVGIAQAFRHGRGWVDPIQWSYYLDAPVPLPALAVRAPVVPLLLSAPLALGATLEALRLLHALWASALVGGLVLLARRWLSLPAAAMAGLAIVCLPAWRFVAAMPLTEATALGLLGCALALAPAALRSARGAAAGALVACAAWLTHPTLALLVPVVALAAALELGPRGALRSRPLWIHLGCFAAAVGAVYALSRTLTGLAPYEAYGFHTQTLRALDAARFEQSYPGTLRFVVAHRDEIARSVAVNAFQLLASLLAGPYHFRVGWLALPAAALALLRRRVPVPVRACALAFVALCAAWSLNYASFDPIRFPLLPAATGVVCGAWALERAARGLARRAGAADPSRAAGLALWAGAAVLASHVALSLRWPSADDVAAFRAGPGPVPACRALDPDARVAAENPWRIFRLCGNAALLLPPDLQSPAAQRRFLEQKQPRYVLARPEGPFRWLRDSPRLAPVRDLPGERLYAVTGAGPASRPWRAAPPIVCAGREPDCTRR